MVAFARVVTQGNGQAGSQEWLETVEVLNGYKTIR
tara:strand:- start:1514 stop:1618 length:105 start_codon:yes stop_codon:yes gene_type:complete